MNTKDIENRRIIASLFAEAAPKIPQTISAEAIEHKIISKQRHRRIKFEQKKNYTPLIAAAACFALFLGLLYFFNPFGNNADKVQNFKSEQELNSFVSALENGSSSELGAGSAFFPLSIYTNNDLKNHKKNITANDKYIFCAYYDSYNDTNRNRIYIFNKDKENPKLINIFGNFTDESNEVSSVAVYKNNLAVTIINGLNISATTKIYDISSPENPVLKAEFEQSGENTSTYLINDTLYIVSFFGTAHDNINGIAPKSESHFVKPENIYRFNEAEYNNYIVIGAINIKSCRRAEDTKAVLGAYYETVFSDECIYLTNGDYSNTKYIKYDLKSGKAEYAKPESINIKEKGEYENQFSIKTTDDTLLYLSPAESGTEAVLYNIADKNSPAVLDSKMLNSIYGNYNQPVITESGSYLFTCYKADSDRRYYGVIEIKIENSKIITAEYKAESSSIMEADICIADDNCIYTIYQPTADSAEIYSFKYR